MKDQTCDIRRLAESIGDGRGNSSDAVLGLAESVVRIGGSAKIINEDNSSGEWVSIGEAVDSGKPFMVEPKHTLAVFDLDPDEYGIDGDELESLAKGFVAENGFSPLWVDSGRNTHLYVFDAGGCERVYEKAKAYGLPPASFRRNGIRPPLSPHRLGLPTSLVDASVDDALRLLGPVELPRPLPSWFERTLREGDYSGRFNGNRSSMALALASAMKSNGMKLYDYDAAMRSRSNLGGAKFHELEDTGRDIGPEIKRFWSDAGISATAFDLDYAQRVETAARSYKWNGRDGNSKRAVMLGLCDLAIGHGTLTPTFGVRRLSLVCGLSKATVIKTLPKLEAERWISKVPGETKADADGYRLRLPLVTKVDHLFIAPQEVASGLTLSHPVFRNGSGLGKTIGTLWDLLSEVPTTVDTLAGASQKSKRTIYRGLKRMEAFGIAERTDDGWIRRGDVSDLDRIADETGATRSVERQVRAFEQERQEFGRSSSSSDDERRRLEELEAS